MQTLHTPNLIIGFGKAGKTLAADLAKAGQSVILACQPAISKTKFSQPTMAEELNDLFA
ncbi:MAG: hypothetical protein Q4E16_05500 [Neisseria sp.]|nr:hypothetical protein [Neisseria sp.]